MTTNLFKCNKSSEYFRWCSW